LFSEPKRPLKDGSNELSPRTDRLTPNRLAFMFENFPEGGYASEDDAELANQVAARVHENMNAQGLNSTRDREERGSVQWELLSSRASTPGKLWGQCAEQSRVTARVLNTHGIYAQHRHVLARQVNDGSIPPSSSEPGALFSYIKDKPMNYTTTVWRGNDFYLLFDFAGLSFFQMRSYLRYRRSHPDVKFEDVPQPKPSWNAGEGCCCVPSDQDDPSMGTRLGLTDDDYAKGTYYLGMRSTVVTSNDNHMNRGDIRVVRSLCSDGVRLRWRTYTRPDKWGLGDASLRYHNQTVSPP